MPPRKASKAKGTPAPDAQIQDYRHAEKRKNIPAAGLASQGKVRVAPKVRYEYDAHLPPVLRFDSTGKSDSLPVDNTIRAAQADKVAAWFPITQAFFPNPTAWDKLARALKSVIDPERFAAFSGTKSLPFTVGKNGRIAVKVIDPQGNEVMRVARV